MNYQIVMSTPIVTNVYYKGCEIIIGEMKTQVDLIKLGEIEYDLS